VVLTAALLSVAATAIHPIRSRAMVALYRTSIALSALLVIMSLSRAVIIALASWPLLALWRSLRSGRVSVRQLTITVVAVFAATGLALAGLLTVVWLRFTSDTTSYGARDELLNAALGTIGDNWLTGGVDTAGQSSHNLVLDSWLRAGVFAAAAALVVLLLLAGLWLMLARRLHLEPDWMLPVTAALSLPLIRAFTVGGGALPPAQWVCLGVVAGFVTFRLQASTSQRHQADAHTGDAEISFR
jgi:hypothetical protein